MVRSNTHTCRAEPCPGGVVQRTLFLDEYFHRIDAQRAYPEAFVNALLGAGWLAAMIPEEYGGSGLGLTAASVIMEEINRCGGNSGAVHMYNMGTVLRHGSRAQKEKDLPAIAAECIGDGYWFIDRASRYASERIVFERPIGINQGVQVCALFDAQQACGAQANMAKYLATKAGSRQLADLGARVIKVERPQSGDFARWVNAGPSLCVNDYCNTPGGAMPGALRTQSHKEELHAQADYPADRAADDRGQCLCRSQREYRQQG